MNATATRSRHTDRETARETLVTKIEGCHALMADPMGFSTYDPQFMIDDAEWRLRWIDCAPEGANHQTAPLQDKTGTPMGGTFYETVECPPKSSRERRPNWAELKTAQHFARLEREAELDRELGVEGQPFEARKAARNQARQERFRATARARRQVAA